MDSAHKSTDRDDRRQNRDCSLVSICFADGAINQIFAALLRAQGVPTRVVPNLHGLTGETRVITEPQFFPDLSPRYFDRTLLVGNSATVQDVPVLTLTRPLTEAKIEHALARFLRT